MRGRRLRTWLALLLVSIGLLWLAGGLHARYRELGRTPGELMDYAQRRLLGHPRLETVALPAMGVLRAWLDAPAAADRARVPFVIPPPPPRRGAADVAAPEALPADVKVWRVSPQGPLRIADAARLARSGDVVEIEAGDYRGDVALWMQTRLTIRGVNGAARLFADGQSAEDKAIWVLRNGDFDISNIDFVGAQVADRNGAGIRFEGGNLRLRDCLFWGNQFGLLTSGSGESSAATLTISGSEFAYSQVKGRWAHNLYVGSIAALTVTGSYFHHADTGHLLKSRARVNHILYNRLTDESGGRASYELNFPNGGFVRLVGNVVQQQRATENSTLIAYGEEGYRWPFNELHVGNNTLVNDHPHGGTFIAVAPGAHRVVAANNLLVGPGVYRISDNMLDFRNASVDWEAFVRASRHDYQLRQPPPALQFVPLPDATLAAELTPQAQYVHPRGVGRLDGPPHFIGADQRP